MGQIDDHRSGFCKSALASVVLAASLSGSTPAQYGPPTPYPGQYLHTYSGVPYTAYNAAASQRTNPTMYASCAMSQAPAPVTVSSSPRMESVYVPLFFRTRTDVRDDNLPLFKIEISSRVPATRITQESGEQLTQRLVEKLKGADEQLVNLHEQNRIGSLDLDVYSERLLAVKRDLKAAMESSDMLSRRRAIALHHDLDSIICDLQRQVR
jgi:hypothetical protein